MVLAKPEIRKTCFFLVVTFFLTTETCKEEIKKQLPQQTGTKISLDAK